MTAELAIVLPALMMMVAVLLCGAMAGVTQLRIEEAARAGARVLARGEPASAAAAVAGRIAGDGAALSVASVGGWVSVEVSAAVPGPLSALSGWRLSATASTRSESTRSEGHPDAFAAGR